MITYASCSGIVQFGFGFVVSDAGADAAGGVALPPKILNMTVPQVGHMPLMALRAFFITSSTASTISFLALHLTQYPSGIKFYRPTHHAPDGVKRLAACIGQRNWEKTR